MFGPVSKSVAAGITNLIALLGYAITVGLIHGKTTYYVLAAIAVLHGVLNVYGVWLVRNQTVAQKLEASIQPIEDTIAEVEKDLHAGVAAAAPWPTDKPPIALS